MFGGKLTLDINIYKLPPTLKHGDGRIMVLEYISSAGTDGQMEDGCRMILKENILETSTNFIDIQQSYNGLVKRQAHVQYVSE